jgi:hypothetical protein
MASDPPGQPPSDPQDWTDDQWIEWLQETDKDDAVKTQEVTLGHKVTHSAAGSALGVAMLGMSEAIYGKQRAEVVIVQEAPSDPEDEDISIHLDPDQPERSVAIVRNRRHE